MYVRPRILLVVLKNKFQPRLAVVAIIYFALKFGEVMRHLEVKVEFEVQGQEI